MRRTRDLILTVGDSESGSDDDGEDEMELAGVVVGRLKKKVEKNRKLSLTRLE